MNKKKIGFLTIAATTLTAFPVIAASCTKNTDYSKEISVEVRGGLTKPASAVTVGDINATTTAGDKITVSVKSVKVSSESNTTLLVTLEVKDNKTGKISEVIKSITGFPQTQNENTDSAQSVNYAELITVSVPDEIKSKFPKDVTIPEVSVTLNSQNATAAVTTLATNKANKSILDVTITITESNGNTLRIVKQIEGFKEEYPEQIQSAYAELPNNINIVKNIASSKYFATAQDGAKVYWDYKQAAFYDKPFVNGSDENNTRVKLFEVNQDFRLGFGVNTVSPREEGKEDSELNNSAVLVKNDAGYSLKFRLSQYKNNKTPSVFYDDVVTSQNQEFTFLTLDQLNEKSSGVTLSYPNAADVKEVNAVAGNITNNLDDENLKISIKEFNPLNGQGKVAVTFTVTTQVGDEVLETEIKNQELTGFKIDDFDAQFANLTAEYPNMGETLASQAVANSFTFKNGDQDFNFPEGVTKTVTIKENSVNDYKGLLTITLNVSKDDNTFTNDYSFTGFKHKEFNFQNYINDESHRPVLNPEIEANKAETNAATLLPSNFTLPEYDAQAVSAEIVGVSVKGDNNTVAVVSVNWTNILVENSDPVLKTYEFDGFKAVESKEYRTPELYALAWNNKLFKYVANEENNNRIINHYEKSKKKDENGRKVAFITIKNNAVTLNKKDPAFTSALSYDESVEVLTHGGNNNVSWPHKKGSNKGIAIVNDGTKYYIEYVLVLANGEDDTEVFKLELFDTATTNAEN
ncbi:lipoprotein 17-related variable surface protein [Mycoplasma sp. HS2188]|uniref:lipoprotein 17-related variable surface protein n=1 Tax=Mycoplasma sp. HS2188 TaxID=2976765 RepID=UPI0021A987C8|nr:lipoprotein 17-related variable surface protein [Mycoplasma sp. HS2188]MCT4469539.1 lipoprotein 17-related variable surface protein [Mycoplasma sp. HS2188]